MNKTRILIILAVVMAFCMLISILTGGTIGAVVYGVLAIVFSCLYLADVEDTMTCDGYVTYW